MSTSFTIGLAVCLLGMVITVVVTLYDSGERPYILFVGLFISIVLGLITWVIIGIILGSIIYLKRESIATDTIVFAGKVTNPLTEEWVNNRLVLVFEKEKEIGRTTTFQGEFPENELGIIDGLFVLEIPNTYRISIHDFKLSNNLHEFQLTTRPNGFLSNRKIIYTWIPEFNENSFDEIYVKSKNFKYTMVVLPGSVTELPPELIGGITEYRNNRIIIIPTQTVPKEVDQAAGDNYILQNIVYNVSTEYITLKKITIPMENCKNDLEARSSYSNTQTYIHKFIHENAQGVSLQFPIPYLTWMKIGLDIQNKYGFEENQIDTTTISYDLYAAPHSNQNYVITWTEVWENGIANVIKDNQAIATPFRIQTNLIYAISSETRSCP